MIDIWMGLVPQPGHPDFDGRSAIDPDFDPEADNDYHPETEKEAITDLHNDDNPWGCKML